ncbi:hypothetical protein LDENG_00198980 [Lucifuga dentata]|nr:hypothetical protein LDENG_00198980 [Lucifuga dentata]
MNAKKNSGRIHAGGGFALAADLSLLAVRRGSLRGQRGVTRRGSGWQGLLTALSMDVPQNPHMHAYIQRAPAGHVYAAFYSDLKLTCCRCAGLQQDSSAFITCSILFITATTLIIVLSSSRISAR